MLNSLLKLLFTVFIITLSQFGCSGNSGELYFDEHENVWVCYDKSGKRHCVQTKQMADEELFKDKHIDKESWERLEEHKRVKQACSEARFYWEGGVNVLPYGSYASRAVKFTDPDRYDWWKHPECFEELSEAYDEIMRRMITIPAAK